RPRHATGLSASRHDLCGPEVSPSCPGHLDGRTSCWLAHRSEDASGGYERLHAAGKTLGDCADERLAWPGPQEQQGLGAQCRIQYCYDPNPSYTSYAQQTRSLRSPRVSLPQGGCLISLRQCKKVSG